MTITPHAFCHSCGLRYRPADDAPQWPKHCAYCGLDVWNTPTPVVVCVQPVYDDAACTGGLAIARRAIEPRRGTWNLIAGHAEKGETAEEAAAREWREETGIEPGALVGIIGSYANAHGHLLLVVEFEPIMLDQWLVARLCPENDAFSIWRGGEPALGFPIHDEIAQMWDSM